MRLFIGINFGEATRTGLAALQDELRAKSRAGNFTLPENLHLTLAFLGDCSDSEKKAVEAAMDMVDFSPFNIKINNLGRFKRGDSEIWWAGLAGCKPLAALHGDLTKSLAAAGFALDTRKYNPHITLARQVITAMQPHQITPITEVITSIDLIQSTRVGGKLIYTPIYTITPKTRTFELPLVELQPSQLYISEEKLARLRIWFRKDDRSNFDPIPIKRHMGRLMMTDGHTRAALATLAGWETVPVVWDDDDWNMEAYTECVRWCDEAGIKSALNLAGRIVSAEDYAVLWDELCDELHERLGI